MAKWLRPQSQALALEPRILFDAAAAVAADQQHSRHDVTDGGDIHPAAATADARGGEASVAPRNLVVIDSQLDRRDELLAQLPAGTSVLIVKSGEDALAAISAALTELGNVDSVQLFSHGNAGEFSLGRTTFTAGTVQSMGTQLAAWSGHLAPGADIQIYGCNVGAGADGQALVDELAHWTGADVGASSNNTGAAALGGDWNLEVTHGLLDRSLALDAGVVSSFDGLLAATVSLSSAGTDVTLGGQFTFTVNFSNSIGLPGYGPFVDLFMPATGRDGDDGISFVSATYLGNNIKTYVVDFDAAGNATHPLATDVTGAPLVLHAADYGLRTGDQLVVIQIPYASVLPAQPVIGIQVTARLSDLADTANSDSAPDLTIGARGGFQFGNDPLDNPSSDPSQVEAAVHPFVVHPTVVSLRQSVDVTEGETLTGPNFAHTQTVTLTPATGQNLQNVLVTQTLPDNVQVTSIDPGGGGTLTSITLHDGQVLTSPALIQAAINSDNTYIDSYTAAYAVLTGPTSIRVGFYVAQSNADGTPVLDPVTGADVPVVFQPPTVSGAWAPLDPRDVVPPATQIEFSGTGSGQGGSFTAGAITLTKEVSLELDAGRPGVTPGDTLQYTLRIGVSDYFAVGENLLQQGQFTIEDRLGDGQTLTGTPTLNIQFDGTIYTVDLVIESSVVNPDGSTTVVFDVAQSIRNATNARGILPGDLAFDDQLTTPSGALISYSALVGQQYSSPYAQSDINEGDSFGNSATVTASVAEDRVNLTGGIVTDSSSTTSTIQPGHVDIDIVTVNGAAPPGDGELRPGDLVTFRLAYDLATGDFEQFSLSANLPLPIFDVSGITWSTGSGEGQWSFGPGNTTPDGSVSVVSTAGNTLLFDFGDFADVNASRVEVQFTLRVSDQPFADQRTFVVPGQSSQVTTIAHNALTSIDVVAIASLAEPLVSISHGVVASSHGTVSGTSGTWNAPGSGGVPFAGSITDIAAIEGSVSGIDAGDLVRLATAIKNRGGGGAWDVATEITLPAGLAFTGGSLAAANPGVYRGDGTALVAGLDYSIAGNSITFLDANDAASLLPGRAGSAAESSGANVIVIVYDVVVDGGIPAASTLQSTVALSSYAGANGGSNFLSQSTERTADQQVASPEVRKDFAGGGLSDDDSSAPQTSGNALVVGERMLYEVLVTLPEGVTQTLRVEDLVPAGMRLDTTFNGGLGYQLITTVAGSATLTADFSGTVTAGAFTGIGGTPGADGVGFQLAFAAASAAADNSVGNNAFVIRLQLIAGNVTGNQNNVSRQNNTQMRFSDPDGDTANGSAVDRLVARTGGAPVIVVREPTLQLTQTVTGGGAFGVDEGDVVEYVIRISNGSGANDVDAFDITLQDGLPVELLNLQLASVSYAGGATNHGGPDFELVGGQLRTVAGANIDIARGGSIELHVTGIVSAAAVDQPTFDNIVGVQWTSLDGTDAGERSGVDGPLGSGVLNDYQRVITATVAVAQATRLSRIGGLPETPAPATTDAAHEGAAIGEIVRYRLITLVPEGTAASYNLQVTLQNGLTFLNDGTIRLEFISNTGMTSDVPGLTSGGTLNVSGNESNPEARPINPQLSGAAATAVLNPSQITVSTDGNGNTVVTFNLGTVVNHDSDLDLEGVSLEFNAVIVNQASNVAGTSLSVTAQERSGSTVLSAPITVYEDVVEPAFTGFDKRVIDFNPNPAGVSGSATVAIAFTHSGSSPAFNAHLVDAFASGTGYALSSIQVGSNVYGPGNLPAGITVDLGSGLAVDFSQLDVGAQVRVVYSVTLPNNATVPNSNATLTWSSLPENFTSWGGSSVGADGAATGERTGTGTSPNTYVLAEGAGLGVISGTLWDDTASATLDANPDGPALPGQPVMITWAGADGNLATTADNLQFSTVTDALGQYRFGVLPAGVFRIDVPAGTISYPQPLGDLRVRIDSDAGSPAGQVVITLGEAATVSAHAGFVQQNDAPVNTLPGAQSGLEDIPLSITGIAVADVDVGTGLLDITLSVLHGTLALSSVPGGVTVNGGGTATLVLSGTLANLNSALNNLVYTGNADYNGVDTLTVLSNDRGGFGDANGDGTPGQVQDALTDQDTLSITLAAVNDAPVGNPDAASAAEAGGTANGTPGVDPRGNVLGNDTDVDIATNADQLRVISAGLAGGPQTTLPGVVDLVITGQYGSLVIATGGGYEYVVDNTNAVVQALRLSGQTLAESFDYTVSDLAGATSVATLTVTVHGANDTPVGVNDDGTAAEAGGVANTTGGSEALGDVLANDTDVDSAINGESRTVTGVRLLRESASGPLEPVDAATDRDDGKAMVGQYGKLTIGADGTWRYEVDNDVTAVQRLIPGGTLVEYFSYLVTDAGGLSDLAELRIVITGTQDNPLASDDVGSAQAGVTGTSVGEHNPTLNVILFPSRAGPVDQPGGNGVDADVDSVDRPSSLLRVSGIRTGTEIAGGGFTGVTVGTTSANGTLLSGSYGVLRIGADGSAFYDLDSDNSDVQSLNPNQTLAEIFSYEITDTAGNTDIAQITITVRGTNDPPVAHPGVALTREAGGVANATPGQDASGDVLANATDPEGDPLSVIAIRTGAIADAGTSGTVGQPLAGLYGTLTLNANGSWTYTVDNANATVQALREAGDLLTERFTYTITDGVLTGEAEIVAVVAGQNDTPQATDDAGIAGEAGGVDNSRPGTPATGNVLDNDSDVDQYGETATVSSVRTGSEAASGTAGTPGTELRGSYGWLTLNEDGSYSYRVDDSVPAVQALRGTTNVLTDSFSYTVADADAAEDRASLNITIEGTNDTPVAVADAATAVEAGGVANATPGTQAAGNVLANDSDVDAYGESLSVIGVSQDGRQALAGTAFVGTWGTLTLNADGGFTYLADDNNPLVQALRTSAQSLTDVFTYAVRDQAGAAQLATLTITVEGRNDNPVAADDAALATEAGGAFNSTPGVNPVGNVLGNDTDVDAGDAKLVTGLRTGAEADGGSFSLVAGQITIAGTYGSLTLGTNGAYTYQVDNTLPAVQALWAGETLHEVFTYRMTDAAGASDIAQLQVTVRGAWDAPVAQNDLAYAVAVNATNPGVDPVGNVLSNDTDVDHDAVLREAGVRSGVEAAGGTFTEVGVGTNSNNGTLLVGSYGELVIGGDGSFVYHVDSDNPVIRALGPTEFATETFTYQVRDVGGQNDLAQLTILIRGRNEVPVVTADVADAVEAGGDTNATPGTDPSGNVLANDSDVEGDPLHVGTIRSGTLAVAGTAGTLDTPLRGAWGDLIIAADGSWRYTVDNNLAAVQALRTSEQTLVDNFVYTTVDQWGGSTDALLSINVHGQNDTPVTSNDVGSATEAGGVRNGTAGAPAAGNVIANDSDVDSAANGERLGIVDFSNAAGTAVAGQPLAGIYGVLTLNTDGSYVYVINDSDPVVQALRTAGETLSETFTYRLTDVAGATAVAQLHITVHGANDAPVATNDGSVASDQYVAPQTSGNVLVNDSDVDGGDALHVSAVQAGADAAGAAAAPGVALAGRYGTLVLNADGSYTYSIDLTNPEVLATAGLGHVLQDVFTYTVTDLEGASDQALLTIDLEISAPYIQPGEGGFRHAGHPAAGVSPSGPGLRPTVFVTPIVRSDAIVSEVAARQADGSDLLLTLDRGIQSVSLGAGLGHVDGQFVGAAVADSRLHSDIDMAWILGRHGRTSLSADGLLPDPSVFAPSHDAMLPGAVGRIAAAPVAPDFSAQLRVAAQRLRGRGAGVGLGG